MGVENYHVIELVGEGSFGKVFKGRHKFTSQTVAMKFIMKHGKSDEDIHNLRQEIEILRKLKHENIIEMLDSFESPQEFCVVTEFAQGELFEILEDDKHLPEEQLQAIAKQLLCDFRFTRTMSTNTVVLPSINGTPLYMAPELVRERQTHNKGDNPHQPYNHTADLWSLWVKLNELFVGEPPFYTKSVYALIPHIVKVPQHRLTWPALLEHPLVKETTDELEAMEMCSATAAERGCVAAWRGEGNKIQTPGGSAFSCPVNSPASSEDKSERNFQDDPQSHIPDSKAVISSPKEEFPAFANADEVRQSGLPSATAVVKNGILLNMRSTGVRVGMEDRDMVRVIEGDLEKYINIFLEVGVPGILLWCLEHLELKDWGRTVAILAKMIGQRPLAIQLVNKGLLEPTRMRRLLDRSSPKEVILDVLMIVSDLARMDKIGNAADHNDMFYEELPRSITQLANLLLSSEEDKTKANAAGALSNFIRNSNKLCKVIVSKGAMQVKLSDSKVDTSRDDDASFFNKGTTIGALLYEGGIVGFLDSRCTYSDPIRQKAFVVDTSDKLFTISSKSNLYYLICGDRERCSQLANHLAGEVEDDESSGELVTVDTVVSYAQQYLSSFLRFAYPAARQSEFGGIIIGWLADKNYQAYRVMLEEQTVQDLECLSNFKDPESLSEMKEKLVVGSGALYADEIYARLHGANAEMNEDLAKAVSTMLAHYSAVKSNSTGGQTHVCVFRHGEPFEPNLRETHEPLDMQLNNLVSFPKRLVLMRVATSDAGPFTDFERAMSNRLEVQCASLMLSKHSFNYYRILCYKEVGATTLLNELMQRHVQSVGPFEQVRYRLGELDINVEMALCTNEVLEFVASS